MQALQIGNSALGRHTGQNTVPEHTLTAAGGWVRVQTDYCKTVVMCVSVCLLVCVCVYAQGKGTTHIRP